MRYVKLLRTCSRVIALTAIVAGLSLAVQAAEPATLTLACKGTVTTGNEKPEPISMGIIVNLTARTILGLAGDSTLVTITSMDDLTVHFAGSGGDPYYTWSRSGNIDRVTGDLVSFLATTNVETKKTISKESLSLKCRSTQRMF